VRLEQAIERWAQAMGQIKSAMMEREDLGFQMAKLRGRLGQITAGLNHDNQSLQQKLEDLSDRREACLKRTYRAAIKVSELLGSLKAGHADA
jgi:small-conductance mechanosensitive channel